MKSLFLLNSSFYFSLIKKNIILFFIIIFLFSFFLYYKIKIKKCAKINFDISICYENRFGSGSYIIYGTIYNQNDSDLINNSHNVFFEFFNNDSFLIYRSPIINSTDIYSYYFVDKLTSNCKRINPKDLIFVKNKKYIVKDLNYKSPFWFIVFN